MLIRILVICLVPFYAANVMRAVREHPNYTRAEKQEWTDRSRLYAIFVSKTSTVLDLKNFLEEHLALQFDGT